METPYILAVDLGTSAIKAFIADTTKNGTIRVIGSSAVPTAGFAKGMLTDVPALAMAVRRAVDNAAAAAEVPLQPVFLGLGGLGIRSYNSVGSIAIEPGKSISQAEVEKVHLAAVNALLPEDYATLHVLPMGYWIDGQKQSSVPLRCKGERMEAEVHVVAIAKNILRELEDALQIAGISVDTVVANVIVGAQILLRQSLPETCLLMDIGAGTADIAVYHGGKLQMSATLPIGGEYITADLMQGLQVSRSHAEGIKRYYAKLDQGLLGTNAELDCNEPGTSDKKVPYDLLYNIVESRVEEITSILFEYVHPLLAKYHIDKVFLTGGCAMMPSMKNSVERIFGMEPEIIQAQGSPAEYVHPTTTACLGILQYAMLSQQKTEAVPQISPGGFFQRISNFFHG